MEQTLYSSVEGRPTLDPARLDALRRLAVLDTEASTPIDRLTAAAKEALKVPVALLSLIDEERQFFKCQIGLPEPWASKRETPFTHSFCRHVVDLGEPLLIEDAREHPVLKENLAIKDLNVIAYAGVPLVTSDGFALGTFSVIDHQPRRWTEREIEILQSFAVGVMASLELYSEKQKALAMAREVRESQTLVQQVTENVNDVLWLLEISTGRVIYITSNVEQVWGITADQLLNDPDAWRDRVHPEDISRVEAKFQAALAGESTSIEFRIIRGGGVQRWLETRLHPVLDEKGHQYRLVGTTEDITERKDLEQKLLQSQRMEAIGRLSAGIAHDFNNLLGVVLGSAEFLAQGEKDPQRAQDVKAIFDAAERGAEIVSQLLIFSKQQPFDPRNLDVNTIIQEMEPLYRRTLREDIDLILTLAPKLPPVRIDRGAFDQVLLNLLVNAREAMPRGGTVAIATKVTEVDQAFGQLHGGIESGTYVSVVVSDTGRGMEEAVSSRVFEPYFTTKPRWESGGLGLSTVLGIIQRVGGALSLYSEPGIGTTFKIYLPSSESDAPSRQLPSSGESGAGQKVLVVEDNEVMLKVVVRLLEASNYEVVFASNGKEALTRLAEAGPFDAVLTDVVMPGMSGRELMGHLRSKGFEGQLIFMSGYTSEILDRHGVLPDEVHYLQKPFTKAELLNVLSQALPKA